MEYIEYVTKMSVDEIIGYVLTSFFVLFMFLICLVFLQQGNISEDNGTNDLGIAGYFGFARCPKCGRNSFGTCYKAFSDYEPNLNHCHHCGYESVW